MFYQATSQLFVMFNKFLQREDPLIHVISEQMGSFIKKLFGKFVAIHAIRDASDITSVHYSRENQLPSVQSIYTSTIWCFLHYVY